jgi:predicted kinase
MNYYVIIRGPLGCGKTTIAKKISRKIHARYIAIDRILEKHHLEQDHEAGYISQKSFKRANEIIAPKAKKILDTGTPIVFDGNFYWKSQITDLEKRLDRPHFIFTLQAPLSVCIARDKKRKKTHGKDAARAVYKKSTSFSYGVVIDVDRPVQNCILDILGHLPPLSKIIRKKKCKAQHHACGV